MKDPAFLFYSQDFIVGTLAMTFEDRGRYITLLCYQHQSGRMSEETIRLLVGFISDNLKSKFVQDEDGLFYNERLENECEKRSKFVESRTSNGKLGGRPRKEEKPNGYPNGYPNGKPTQNLREDEDENVNIKENIEEKEEIKTWKNDFEIYTKSLNTAINELLQDKKWMEQREKFNPGVDIKLTLEKAYTDYWSTEAAWKHKKAQRISDINWKTTMNNAIELNKVYKPR